MNGKTENAKKYIDDIIKDLPDSKYTQRFREELLEHVEDIEMYLTDQEDDSNQIKTNIMQKIGDKEVLTESFRAFYRSCLSRLWPIELLAYLVFSYYALFAIHLLMQPYELITDSSSWIFRLITLAFSALATFVFCYIMFSLIAKRLLPHISNKKNRFLTALASMLAPIASFLYDWGYILWYDTQIKGDWGFFTSEYFAVTILKLAIIATAASAAFGILPHNKNRSSKNAKVPYLLVIIFLALIINNFLLAQQKAGTLSAAWQFSNAINSFLELPLYFLTVFLEILVTLAVYISAAIGLDFYRLNLLSTTLVLEIYAVTLILMAAGGIWLIVHTSKTKAVSNKDWKYAAGIALTVYCAFVLLPINKVREEEEDSSFNVPAFNLTKKIKQDQFGPLYPAQEYLAQTDGTINYFYTICQKENVFTIVEPTGDYFELDLNNIQGGQVPKASTIERNNSNKCSLESSSLFTGMLSQGFECSTCKENNIIGWNSQDYMGLTYNGHRIFKDENPAQNLSYFKISNNQDWALFEISDGNIYLIDLRNLR